MQPRAGDTTIYAGPAAFVPRPAAHPRDGVTPGEVLWTLLDRKWLVLSFVAGTLALAGLYLLNRPPIYQAQALVRLQDRIGAMPGFEEVSATIGESTVSAAEMELIRSRSVLDAAVGEVGLDVEARPRLAPLFGRVLYRLHGGGDPAPARLGLKRYSWGGDRIRVARLVVPDSLAGQPLVLTAQEAGRYRLADPDGAVLLEGRSGEPATGPGGEQRVELLVAELIARPGTEFVVEKRGRGGVVGALGANLEVEERGKASGLVAIRLQGTDPARVAATVNAIAAAYLRQNNDRISGQANRTLEHFESQLPPLRKAVERSESAYNAFQTRSGIVNLSQASESALGRSVETERTLAELQVQRAELAQRYTEQHPSVAELDSKIQALRSQRATMDRRMRAIPAAELQTARLTRDVRVATDLYLLLLEKTQAVRMVATAGALGSARLVEAAVVPELPSGPGLALALPIAMVVGLVAGSVAALGRKRVEGAADPIDLEEATGIPVLATIPHSRGEASLFHRVSRRGPPRPAMLSLVRPGDVAVEDLRTLRTNLQSALLGARNNVVAITGPSPQVGKSFVCVNLAYLLAATKRRVLVLDADLRRGELHRRLGVPREPGLAELLNGTATLDSAISRTGSPQLDVIAAGNTPPDPAELLGGPELQRLLTEVAGRYDVVLVDTPAVLAVTDSALVARHAGLTLLVLRSGAHPLPEVDLTAKRLAQGGVEVGGTVLNDVRESRRRYGRYGRYRRYEYDDAGR